MKHIARTVLVFCGLILLGRLESRPALGDGPVPLAEYASIAARAERLAAEAAAQPDGLTRQALCWMAADALDAVRSVTLESGDSISVDNQALIAQLRQPAPTQASAQAAQERLAALRDGLRRPAGTLIPADREKLRALLAQPPFSQPVSDDTLTRLIDELLARIFGSAARGTYSLGPAIVVVGILLALAVLAYFVLVLRRSGASEAALAPDDATGEQLQTASAAFSGAQRYITAGDYRTAVRLLYLGTLLRLDERGLLRYDRSLTNREYLRAVSGSPFVRDALRPVVETFDRTWYGFGPISAGEFADYEAQVEALRNAHLP